MRVGATWVAPAVAGALLALAAAPAGAQPPLQHVTLIGDSVASSIPEDPAALAILGQGIDLDLEVAPCRRVGDDSCPYMGSRPPNVIQLVQSMGSALGPTVVVVAGYNDFPDDYPQSLAAALAALRAAGVQHVLWLTLRAAEHPYVGMNDALLAAAAQQPALVVVDWNLYSRSHPDWFQPDGIHLVATGSEAMATLIHQTLLGLGIAAAPTPKPAKAKLPHARLRVVTARLPAARLGRRYAAKLKAAGGRGPYFWSFPTRPPRGLHVRPTGWIFGTPAGTRARAVALTVRVSDASGGAATQRLVLRLVG